MKNDVVEKDRVRLDAPPQGEYKEYEAYRLSKTGKILKVKLHGKELTKEELQKFKDQVEAGKLKEIGSWVSHGAISIIHEDDALTRPMTARWVVQWKEMPDGTYVIKCRLVVRGFQDPQGYGMETYSPTGSRLSQRLLLSTCVLYHWEVVSMDIGTAFLQGQPLEEADPVSGKTRAGCMMPPDDCWKYLPKNFPSWAKP